MMIGMFTNNWQRWKFAKGLQRNKSPIDYQFLMSVHILNMRTCLRGGNFISGRYGLAAPTLTEYLRVFD